MPGVGKGENMMYPYLTFDDNTEIVHSELHDDKTVDVYVETPCVGGFKSAYCRLPDYKWTNIEGYSKEEIEEYQKIIESNAHLIIRFAETGGFDNASGF